MNKNQFIKSFFVLAGTIVLSGTASAGILVPQVTDFIPGPSIIAVLRAMFGG
jgi:hypothetical protein